MSRALWLATTKQGRAGWAYMKRQQVSDVLQAFLSDTLELWKSNVSVDGQCNGDVSLEVLRRIYKEGKKQGHLEDRLG